MREENMLEAIRDVRPWQIAAIVIVLLAAGGGTYGGLRLLQDNGGEALELDQQLIPVQRGDLVNEVSINGSLLFPDRETLRFGVQGTVGRVLLEEGQQVTEGQLLIALDEETVTNLEKAAAQARVTLRDAEDTVADLQSQATALDLAQAEASVANARVAHMAAESALAVLLETDPRELALKELAVANATVALEDASDVLAKLLEPPSSQTRARAESTVTGAKLALQSSEDALDSLLNPTAEEMAKAEASVTDAERSLQVAEEALESLLTPTAQQIAEAELAVSRARLLAADASAALLALEQGPADDEIANAQSDVESAITALADTRVDQELTGKEWAGKVEAALDSVDAALDGYERVFLKWLGAELTADETLMDPDALLAAWDVDLAALFDPGTRFSGFRQPFLATAPVDDPATQWDEGVVVTWVNFYPGEIVVTCESGSAPFQGVCIEEEMSVAWDAVDNARDQFDTTVLLSQKALSGAETGVARADDSVANAEDRLAELTAAADILDIETSAGDLELALLALQTREEELAALAQAPEALDVAALAANITLASARLETARADLAALKSDPDPVEVEGKNKQIALAKADLETAEADLAELKADLDKLEIEAREKQIALAEADLEEARNDLVELLGGPGPLELDASRKQLSVTLAKLGQAEEDLEELKAGPDALVLTLREADTASARASMEVALLQLEDAFMRAPWSGIVTVLNVETGDSVNRNTPVLEIVDPTVVEVDGIVDEIDVLFIRQGAAALVTMDALPGQTLDGIVSEVASESITQQGVVSYPMRIRLQPSEGVLLPEGLSAVASVVIREERDVLLVPLQALRGSFDEPAVMVMFNGKVDERAVELGNSDDFWVVIQGGLAEGEQVVWQTEQATTSGGFGGFGGGNSRRFQGGFTSGGIPGGAGRARIVTADHD
jgi:RND family efflux transporter MFP subunit